MARRSSRLRGVSPLHEQHTWNYQGKHERLWDKQSLCAGQEVTHDCAILHPTTNKNCGHTFILTHKDKKGNLHGKVHCDDGSSFDIKASAGHIVIAKKSNRKRKSSGKTLGVKRKRVNGKLTARKTQQDLEKVVAKTKDKDVAKTKDKDVVESKDKDVVRDQEEVVAKTKDHTFCNIIRSTHTSSLTVPDSPRPHR